MLFGVMRHLLTSASVTADGPGSRRYCIGLLTDAQDHEGARQVGGLTSVTVGYV
jgi:hypothetical protein